MTHINQLHEWVSGSSRWTNGVAFEGAALVLGQATPHAGGQPVLQGEPQAGVDDQAAEAHHFGLLDLSMALASGGTSGEP
jgi:hypothetical protein